MLLITAPICSAPAATVGTLRLTSSAAEETTTVDRTPRRAVRAASRDAATWPTGRWMERSVAQLMTRTANRPTSVMMMLRRWN
jgi:hypothetical protein